MRQVVMSGFRLGRALMGVAPPADSAARVQADEERAGTGRIVQQIVAAISVALVVLAIVFFGSSVDTQIMKIRDSRNEEVVRSLGSSVVAFRELQYAVVDPEEDARLQAIERELADLSGWIERLGGDDIFAEQRKREGFASALDEVRSGILSVRGLLAQDPPDLDEVRRSLASLENEILRLEATGTEAAQVSSARLQYEVAATLVRLAAFVALLLITLLLLTIYLSWQGRILLSRARREARTATRLETILGFSEDGVVMVDSAGRIQMLGESAAAMLGVGEDDVRDSPLSTLLGLPEGKMAELREACMDAIVERDVVTPGGKVIPTEISARRAASSGETMFVYFIRDITHRRKIEQELIKARDEALAGQAAKASFVAVVSHEIRTPLNGIIGIIELLSDTDLNDEQKKLLENMEVSSRILLSHLNNVLDISRAEAGSLKLAPRPSDLRAIVRDVIQSLSDSASSKGNTLTCGEFSGEGWIYLVDSDRLRQVLMNLVGNAQKFTKDGTISVEVERLVERADRDTVEIRVVDTGIGIPDHMIDRIFDDFETLDTSYSRNQSGAGLGLGIVRRLVEAMNGRISADSLEGCGTQFTIHLELEHAEIVEVTPNRSIEAGERVLRRNDVLVVEDNEINRSVIRGLLQKTGARVECAENGREGADKAKAARFDLIFMDISMPVLDGVSATREIRSGGASADSDIIATTADITFPERDVFSDAGFSGFVTKPMSREVLHELVYTATLPDIATGKGQKGRAAHPLRAEAVDEMLEDLGQEAVTRLVGELFREVEEFLDRASGEAIPAQEAAAELHTLAGASGTCGAQWLFKTLKRAEASCREGNAITDRDLHALRDALASSRTAFADCVEAFSSRKDGPSA